MSKEREIRCLAASELRASGDHKLVGYAAVFNSLSENLGGFREIIKPGAFASSIAGHADVRALLNHDPNKVLGRTTAGTLELSEDQRGLRSVIHLPDTQVGRDLYTSVSRGDISQMSFGFTCKKDAWSKDSQGGQIRELLDVALMDVSSVTYPAYQATSVGVRSNDGKQSEIGWYRGQSVIESDVDDRERLRLMLELAQRIK